MMVKWLNYHLKGLMTGFQCTPSNPNIIFYGFNLIITSYF